MWKDNEYINLLFQTMFKCLLYVTYIKYPFDRSRIYNDKSATINSIIFERRLKSEENEIMFHFRS